MGFNSLDKTDRRFKAVLNRPHMVAGGAGGGGGVKPPLVTGAILTQDAVVTPILTQDGIPLIVQGP